MIEPAFRAVRMRKDIREVSILWGSTSIPVEIGLLVWGHLINKIAMGPSWLTSFIKVASQSTIWRAERLVAIMERSSVRRGDPPTPVSPSESPSPRNTGQQRRPVPLGPTSGPIGARGKHTAQRSLQLLIRANKELKWTMPHFSQMAIRSPLLRRGH
jgi:hypothetical protein